MAGLAEPLREHSTILYDQYTDEPLTAGFTGLRSGGRRSVADAFALGVVPTTNPG